MKYTVFSMIFLKGICVLERVEIIHKSKFLPGTVEKNSSTIRSSGRNRTYACAMPVHCSDHQATEAADRSKRNQCVFRVAMPANGLRVNHYDFVALHSMWIIFLKGICVVLRHILM